ncbi:putative transporter [Fictibacillus macauensis ZFHKF-1]|uniref:Putative transporter n=1 Tax=Fictibacillus macauensis ZFHKF-1 TaxID=1196324 RepID=I8AHB2_9BACL|nr:solute:sodium symporter family transporter [Fictibacillus macauensis]EIT84829.1 putative transporter [Fictibacillus macauensis ZFHKF-1]
MQWLTIITFLIFTGFVGAFTYYKSKGKVNEVHTNDTYFLGGRSLKGGVIAASLMLTNLSTVNFIGMSGQAYKNNMSVISWEVTSGLALVVVAFFLIPRYLKAAITTIPEFLEDRYDTGVKTFVTYLFMAGYILNGIPVTLYTGSVALGQIFDVAGSFHISQSAAIWVMVWAIGIIGAIYTLFGGLKGIAISDTIYGIGLLIIGFAVLYFSLRSLGHGHFTSGFSKLFEGNDAKMNAIGSSTDPEPFGTLFTGMLLVNLYYWGTDQAIIQRVLGATNLKEGQKGVVLAAFMKVMTPFFIIIPGIIAFKMYGNSISNSDYVYPQLVNDVLPGAMKGFFAAVMFGAVLSTFNGMLNSASTLFSINVYKAKNKATSEASIIKKGKWFGIILTIASLFIAPFIMYAPNGLFQYLQMVNGFTNVPILTVIVVGYLSKRIPAVAAKISLALFVSVYALLQLVIKPDIHYLYQLAILFVVCVIVMMIVGTLKPRHTPYALPITGKVNIQPWKHRFEASGIVIFAMLGMYVFFSKLGFAGKEGVTIMTFVWLAVIAVILAVLVIVLKVRDKKKILHDVSNQHHSLH